MITTIMKKKELVNIYLGAIVSNKTKIVQRFITKSTPESIALLFNTCTTTVEAPRIGALPSKRTAPRYEEVPRYAGF